jgi:hypothetical protein
VEARRDAGDSRNVPADQRDVLVAVSIVPEDVNAKVAKLGGQLGARLEAHSYRTSLRLAGSGGFDAGNG